MSSELREHAPGLWSNEQPLALQGFIPIHARMTVIGLPGGGLLLHSPLGLDAELRRQIDAQGEVRFIVAPNDVHHLYIPGACEAYPRARCLAAPGLPEKCPQLRFDGLLGEKLPPEWEGTIEAIPVEGVPKLNEVALLVRPLRTLVLSDLVFNIHRAESLRSRIFYGLNGVWRRFGASRLVRLGIRDRAAFRRSMARVLAWDFDRVVMGHGDVLETGGAAAMRKAFPKL